MAYRIAGKLDRVEMFRGTRYCNKCRWKKKRKKIYVCGRKRLV